MISISLNNIGKKFNREWIFRNVDLAIEPGSKKVILGGNGSGKSTLLQIISGFITPNEGRVNFQINGSLIDPEQLFRYISLASPYLQLVEEFTLTEAISHSARFKPFRKDLTHADVAAIIDLRSSANKPVKQFSSGMKQRLRLGLAILADTPLLLLDEPVSNLDKAAISWYNEMISLYGSDRTIIVCSNAIRDEFSFCDSSLNIADYKN